MIVKIYGMRPIVDEHHCQSALSTTVVMNTAIAKTAIIKNLLAIPFFITPLPRVIDTIIQCKQFNGINTPGHVLVINAIVKQKNWLRRRTLLLRMLTDKHRATWH